MNQKNIRPAFHVEPLTLEQARRLYAERMVEDFPSNELKPMSVMERACERGEYTFFGAMADGDILAYAFFAQCGGEACALLDYFAVAQALRDRGLGGAFLRALVSGPLRGMRGVLLEIEDPDAAATGDERLQRERRRQFYRRNGMKDTGVTAKVFGVDFLLLSMPVGPELSPDDVRHMYARLYRAMLPPEIYVRQVVIH